MSNLQRHFRHLQFDQVLELGDPMKLLLSVFIIFTTSITFATPANPLIRACLRASGEFVAADVPGDQIALCKVGASFISATSLMSYFDNLWVDDAGMAFATSAQNCWTTTLQATSLEGQVIQLCRFEDGSMLDLETLLSGPYDPRNEALKAVFGVK